MILYIKNEKVRFNDDLDIHYVEKITIPSNSELSDLESRDSEKKNRFNIFLFFYYHFCNICNMHCFIIVLKTSLYLV